MDAFGLSDDLKAQILESAKSTQPEHFTVLEENAQALDVFMFCQTQWRQSMIGPTGLDYTAVISVISVRVRKKNRKQVLDDVHLIESGALRAISKRKKE